jgi:DNA-binding HxlR family transcriptional regulator
MFSFRRVRLDARSLSGLRDASEYKQVTCVTQVTTNILYFVLKRDYEGQVCSIARALEVVGDRWTLLVVRDVALGRHRFDELLESLGIASNVLADRLNRLVDADVLQRVRYNERPERFEYHLSEKGLELAVALLALMHWGDRHLSDKPPLIARRRSDRSALSVRIVAKDGSTVAPDELEFVAGPGLNQPELPRTRPSPSRR